MAATARVVVLMEDDEKTELEAKARAANKSLGAYMRERALGSDDDERIDQLLALVQESTAQATAALDRTLAKLDAAELQQASREAEARRRAIKEFAELDHAGLAALVAGGAPAEARRASPRRPGARSVP